MIEVHDQSGNIYNIKKQIRFKTSTLESDLCDYSGDAYIVVKGTSTVQTDNNRVIDGYNENLILKNKTSFITAYQRLIMY